MFQSCLCPCFIYKPIGSCRVAKSITSTFWNTLLFHTMRQTTKISIEGTSILIYFHNPFHPTHRNCSQVKFNAPQRTLGKFFWLYWLLIIIAESDQNNSQVIMIYLSSKNICLLSITRWLHTYILAPPNPPDRFNNHKAYMLALNPSLYNERYHRKVMHTCILIASKSRLYQGAAP